MSGFSLTKLLVDLLFNLDKRVSKVEGALQTIAESVDNISKCVGTPSGYATFTGRVDVDPKELLKKAKDTMMMGLGDLQMEVQFSQAVYMGVRPENNERLAEMFELAQLGQMESLLEQAKRLTELNESMRIRLSEVEALTKDHKRSVQLEAENLINRKVGKALRVAEEHLVKAEKQEQLVEKALARLESVMSEAQMLTAKAGNALAVSERPSKIFTVSKKK